MCVCWFKEAFHIQFPCTGKIWTLENCGVQEVDLGVMQKRFHFYRLMVVVQDLNKVVKVCFRVCQNAPDIVQIAEVYQWVFWTFLQHTFLPVSHINVGIAWCETFSHCSTLDLKIEFILEDNIVSS